MHCLNIYQTLDYKIQVLSSVYLVNISEVLIMESWWTSNIKFDNFNFCRNHWGSEACLSIVLSSFYTSDKWTVFALKFGKNHGTNSYWKIDTYKNYLVSTSEKKTKHANPSQQIGIYSYLDPQIKLKHLYKGGTRISTWDLDFRSSSSVSNNIKIHVQ